MAHHCQTKFLFLINCLFIWLIKKKLNIIGPLLPTKKKKKRKKKRKKRRNKSYFGKLKKFKNDFDPLLPTKTNLSGGVGGGRTIEK